MVKKIISGGQTGVDRAALDTAMELAIPHGGWVPRGRKAEDGVIPRKYKLKETRGEGYPERTVKNVLDSDGTLIISHGALTGGSAVTLETAERHGRPCFHADLLTSDVFHTTGLVKEWIERFGIKVLNVAGPRASQDPAIYEKAGQFLKTLFSRDRASISTSQRDQ